MASVTFDQATRQHKGSERPSVSALDLEVHDGEFLVLVGPSGCGKSTTLRILAGLEPVDGGRILIDGHDQDGVRPRDRDVAMVFQSYALYPTMTARQNMAFALENAGIAKAQIDRQIDEAAAILELEPLLDRKPGQMSGGQRQRVAMGRAIVRQPKVFCMDEPLSNLDAKLRVSTRAQIAALQKRLAVTTLYVTHDQVEAMTMGHRVAVLKDGVLQQVDTPEELYERPRNTFVAGFIGSPAINLAEGRVGAGRVEVFGVKLAMPNDTGASGDRITVGIRPESFDVVPSGTPESFDLDVELIETLGSEAYVYGRPRVDGEAPRIGVKVGKQQRPQGGATFTVRPRTEGLHLSDVDSGLRV